MADRFPVAVLTGFLGSGKTTLLAKLLEHPDMGETAVLVNELGEIGIDHHLLRRVDERTVLLSSGCLCCTMRDDLSEELRDLLSRRTRGEVPPFRRVVIETTGLADPAPIAYTLLSEPVVRHHFELEAVVTTVDAVTGLHHPESIKQAAAADTLVVTKTDVAEPAAVAEVESRLRRINPMASVLKVSFGQVAPGEVLERGTGEPRHFAAPERAVGHEDGVHAFCLVLDEQLDWTAFGIWLSMLLARHGQDVLRVKGLLDVGGEGPLLLNGVQHVIHPPVHLDRWSDDDRRSRIVFIVRGLEWEAIENSLAAFNRAVRG